MILVATSSGKRVLRGMKTRFPLSRYVTKTTPLNTSGLHTLMLLLALRGLRLAALCAWPHLTLYPLHLLPREQASIPQNLRERQHHARIELPARVLPNLFDSLFGAQSVAIGAVGSHGVPGVASMNGATVERDLFALEPVGIAPAI